MPSQSLLAWRAVRRPRLHEVEAQCAAAASAGLTDENLRGYVLLLSAHLQGFCRDLHTECVQILSFAAPPSMAVAIQTFGTANRGLDGGNPRYETIRQDFQRFAFDLNIAVATDPGRKAAHERRVTHLGHLGQWRNHCAHHKVVPPTEGGPLSVAVVRAWQDSCYGFAEELDRVMYHELGIVIGSHPW